MKNIEKYEEEIKKQIANFRDIPCIAKELKDGGCGECRNCVTCSMEMLHWLSQEYKEPILTDKEKACLKKIIKPKRDSVIHIRKIALLKGTENEFINIVIATKDTLEGVAAPGMPFEGMKLEREYTLEELDL